MKKSSPLEVYSKEILWRSLYAIIAATGASYSVASYSNAYFWLLTEPLQGSNIKIIFLGSSYILSPVLFLLLSIFLVVFVFYFFAQLYLFLGTASFFFKKSAYLLSFFFLSGYFLFATKYSLVKLLYFSSSDALPVIISLNTYLQHVFILILCSILFLWFLFPLEKDVSWQNILLDQSGQNKRH